MFIFQVGTYRKHFQFGRVNVCINFYINKYLHEIQDTNVCMCVCVSVKVKE